MKAHRERGGERERKGGEIERGESWRERGREIEGREGEREREREKEERERERGGKRERDPSGAQRLPTTFSHAVCLYLSFSLCVLCEPGRSVCGQARFLGQALGYASLEGGGGRGGGAGVPV